MFPLYFHNHLKSVLCTYYSLFSCLKTTNTSLSFCFSRCSFFFKGMSISSSKVIHFQGWHLPGCLLESLRFCSFSFCWAGKSTKCLWNLPCGVVSWEIPWLDFPVEVSGPLLLLWLLCYNLFSRKSQCKIMAI